MKIILRSLPQRSMGAESEILQKKYQFPKELDGLTIQTHESGEWCVNFFLKSGH